MPLDLTFSDEQNMLRDMVRGVCEQHGSLARLRELEDDPHGFSPDLWRQLGELDLLGVLVPSEYGGLGMTLTDAVVLYEEFGRLLVPSPHFVSAVLAAGILSRAGSVDQRETWLPAIASGSSVVGLAWLEASGGYREGGITATATRRNGKIVVNGAKRHVAFAADCDAFIVVARADSGEVELFVVPASSAGITMTQKMTIGSDAQYDVTFDNVEIDEAAQLCSGGWATLDAALTDGAILLAAQAIGGARYTLDITVEYAKVRQQFDKPLGAFQALAHDMANALTAIDGGEVLVHEAAWARDAGKPFRKLAAMAKLFACDTFRNVTAMAQQIWGGVGFTVEYDVQLYFRRAKQLQISWWDSARLEEIIADEVFAEASSQ